MLKKYLKPTILSFNLLQNPKFHPSICCSTFFACVVGYRFGCSVARCGDVVGIATVLN